MTLDEVKRIFPEGTKVVFKDNPWDIEYRDTHHFGNGKGVVIGHSLPSPGDTCLYITFENGNGGFHDGVYEKRFNVIEDDPLKYADEVIAELERGR